MSAIVVEDVSDGGEEVRVRARTRDAPVPCPLCGTPTAKVHGYHWRTVADVPVDGRRVVVRLRVRRLACPVPGCRRQTFREQVPGLLERLQRRTTRLTRQVSQVVKELCGRAAARLTHSLATPLSYAAALRLLRRIPTPLARVPRVIGVDDFALKRRHRYATVIINAETGERVDVLPDRTGATLTAWLLAHPARPRQRLRRPTHPDRGQRCQAHRLDRRRPGRRSSPSALALQRTGDRSRRRERRRHPALAQRPHRRRQHANKANHAPNARPRQFRPPPPPHPALGSVRPITGSCG